MIHVGKISKKQLLKAERKARREDAIANNMVINHNRVHKSKKTYNRKKVRISLVD